MGLEGRTLDMGSANHSFTTDYSLTFGCLELPNCPYFNILHQYVMFVTINEAILIHYYTLLILPKILPNVHYVVQDPIKDIIEHLLSCLFRLLLTVIVSQTLHVSDDCNNFGEYCTGIFRNLPKLGILWFLFFMIRLGLLVLQRKKTSKFPFS